MAIDPKEIEVGGVYEGGKWPFGGTAEVLVLTSRTVLAKWDDTWKPSAGPVDEFAKWATRRIDQKPKESEQR